MSPLRVQARCAQIEPAAERRSAVWNVIHIGKLVEQLRAEGHLIDDTMLAHTTPLIRKHLNSFGRYHFDLDRTRQKGRSNW